MLKKIIILSILYPVIFYAMNAQLIKAKPQLINPHFGQATKEIATSSGGMLSIPAQTYTEIMLELYLVNYHKCAPIDVYHYFMKKSGDIPRCPGYKQHRAARRHIQAFYQGKARLEDTNNPLLLGLIARYQQSEESRAMVTAIVQSTCSLSPEGKLIMQLDAKNLLTHYAITPHFELEASHGFAQYDSDLNERIWHGR